MLETTLTVRDHQEPCISRALSLTHHNDKFIISLSSFHVYKSLKQLNKEITRMEKREEKVSVSLCTSATIDGVDMGQMLIDPACTRTLIRRTYQQKKLKDALIVPVDNMYVRSSSNQLIPISGKFIGSLSLDGNPFASVLFYIVDDTDTLDIPCNMVLGRSSMGDNDLCLDIKTGQLYDKKRNITIIGTPCIFVHRKQGRSQIKVVTDTDRERIDTQASLVNHCADEFDHASRVRWSSPLVMDNKVVRCTVQRSCIKGSRMKLQEHVPLPLTSSPSHSSHSQSSITSPSLRRVQNKYAAANAIVDTHYSDLDENIQRELIISINSIVDDGHYIDTVALREYDSQDDDDRTDHELAVELMSHLSYVGKGVNKEKEIVDLLSTYVPPCIQKMDEQLNDDRDISEMDAENIDFPLSPPPPDVDTPAYREEKRQ